MASKAFKMILHCRVKSMLTLCVLALSANTPRTRYYVWQKQHCTSLCIGIWIGGPLTKFGMGGLNYSLRIIIFAVA